MIQENTNWKQSVAGVVLKDGKVLLVRHTYGVRKGRLIVPGGYLLEGELPEEAVRREVLEETGVTVHPDGLIGIRFNQKDWYAVFLASYVDGEARSDGDENSEAVWMDIQEAIHSDECPDLTKKLILCAISGKLNRKIDYDGTTRYGDYSFYAVGYEEEIQ